MSLSELIGGVEDHEKTLTVFNAEESVVDEFRAELERTVDDVYAEGRPESFADVLAAACDTPELTNLENIFHQRLL